MNYGEKNRSDSRDSRTAEERVAEIAGTDRDALHRSATELLWALNRTKGQTR